MEIQRKAKLRGWIYIHNMHLLEKLGRGWVSAWKGNEGIFFHTNCAQLVWLCDLVDYNHAKLLCLWISQARILEWVAISFSRGPSWPRDGTCISFIGRQIAYTEPPEKSFFPLIEPQFSRAARKQLQFFFFFTTLDFLAAKGGQFWSRKNKWEFPVWHVQSLEIITHILITRKMLNTLKINNFS